MGCGVKWMQVNELDRAMGALQRAGLGPGNPIYNQLFALRGKVFGQIGFKFPRATSLLKLIPGLSPGSVRVFHDIEAGWLVEARAGPGSGVVRKYVSDQIAIKLIKGEMTHELEEFLMTPDDYLGE